MLFSQVFRLKPTQIYLLHKHIARYASDASKTATATAARATTAATATPTFSPPHVTASGGVAPPAAQSQVKVTVQQTVTPPMDVVVDTSTLPKTGQAVDDLAKSISFDAIPGPISLRITKRIWQMVPTLTTQLTVATVQYLLAVGSLLSWSGNMALFKRFFDHYGPVVRLHGPLGGDIVMVSRPEHVAEVFKMEGPYPVRSTLDSVEKYRLQHRKLKNSGPFLMFGTEWENFRKSVEQPFQVVLAEQLDKIDETCDKFVTHIAGIRNRQEEVPGTFYKEIYKWCLECMCLVTLDKKLGFLDPCGLSSTSDPGVLLDSLMSATTAIQRCEYGIHLWQLMKTPAWNSLIEHCDAIDNVLSKYVHRLQNSLKEKKEADNAQLKNKVSCLMENVLLRQGIMFDDAMTILLDLMLIGTNATTHTTAFMFYHLAKYPKCQVKLYNEIMKQPTKLTRENIAAMPYLQACIKESLRLKPPIPLLGRVLQNDILVHNYHVPKGTYVLMVPCLSSWREEYFEDAHKFVPERWLTPTDELLNFASIPFGHGPKACLGKELAQLQIGMLVAKVLRKFKIDYLYGDISSNNRLWSAPNKKLRFRFADRPQ